MNLKSLVVFICRKAILLALLIHMSCDESEQTEQPPAKLIINDNDEWDYFDEWDDLRSGTFENDTSYWIVASRTKTTTGDLSYYVAIKKSVLRSKTLPLTLTASDYVLAMEDEGSEPKSFFTCFDNNSTFEIQKIELEMVFGTFSASSSGGNTITGEMSYMPLNYKSQIKVGLEPQQTFAMACEGSIYNSSPLLVIDGNSEWDQLIFGTLQNDTSYWMVYALKLTNTVGLDWTYHIFIKKSVLRNSTYPLTLTSGDFLLSREDQPDEPRTFFTCYNADPIFEIEKVDSQTVFGTFSGSADGGKKIQGVLGLPLNYDGGLKLPFLPPCN